jgi:hypothetical protein
LLWYLGPVVDEQEPQESGQDGTDHDVGECLLRQAGS